MAFKYLQEFIKTLEEKGELIRIAAEVDLNLEIIEIADGVSKIRTSITV